MEIRPVKVFVPNNTFEKVALQSIDQGKMGNFIFDNQTSITHTFFSGLINGVLKLPPVKRFLLNEKVYPRLFKLLLKHKKIKHVAEGCI